MNEEAKYGLIFIGGAVVGSLTTYFVLKTTKKDISTPINPEIEAQIKANKEFTVNKPAMEDLLKKYDTVEVPKEEPVVKKPVEEAAQNDISELAVVEIEKDNKKKHRYPQKPRRLDDHELNLVDTSSFNTITYMVTEDDRLTVVDDDFNILTKDVLVDELGLYSDLVKFAKSDEGSAGWIIEPAGDSDDSESVTYIFDKSFHSYYELTGIDIYKYHEG